MTESTLYRVSVTLQDRSFTRWHEKSRDKKAAYKIQNRVLGSLSGLDIYEITVDPVSEREGFLLSQ